MSAGPFAGYVDGYASCWAFRWTGITRPGTYCVTISVSGFLTCNFVAVVDDFGNLVQVPA